MNREKNQIVSIRAEVEKQSEKKPTTTTTTAAAAAAVAATRSVVCIERMYHNNTIRLTKYRTMWI